MVLRFPKEIKDLEPIFEPYLEGCHLRDDAPEEAKEALAKYDAWIQKTYEEHGL